MIDTNAVDQLVRDILSQHAQKGGGESYYALITLATLTISQLVLALANYFKSRTVVVQANQAKQTAVATAEQIDKVYVAVNGERKRLHDELSETRRMLEEMYEKHARLMEYRRVTAEIPTRIKVAILDDDKMFGKLCIEWLKKEPWVEYEVDCYHSVEKAKIEFMRMEHDIYLVDMKLQGCNGIEVIRELTERGHIGPFMVICGLMNHEIEQAGLADGIQLLLSKDELTGDSLGRHIRFAVQAFRTAQMNGARSKKSSGERKAIG